MYKANAVILGMKRKNAAKAVVYWTVGFLLGGLASWATPEKSTPVDYQPKLTTSVVV